VHNPVIPTLGAEHGIDERNNKRSWYERHLFCGQLLSAVRRDQHGRPIDLIEFHCVLMCADGPISTASIAIVAAAHRAGVDRTSRSQPTTLRA